MIIQPSQPNIHDQWVILQLQPPAHKILMFAQPKYKLVRYNIIKYIIFVLDKVCSMILSLML